MPASCLTEPVRFIRWVLRISRLATGAWQYLPIRESSVSLLNPHQRGEAINAVQIDRAPFRNSFAEELRGEPRSENRPRRGPGYCYPPGPPTAVRDPHLLAWADDLAHLLGLERPPERGPAV